MALTGNKGEWSEIYVLFKLLGDKELYAGDENLNKIESLVYPIIKILRKEQDNDFVYKVDGDFIVVSGGEEIRIPIEQFTKQACHLLTKIKEATGSSFSIPEVEMFMSSVSCSSLKACSTDKTDIKIVIHDLRTGTTPLLGFSIKSQLGSPSTLLNPGIPTNITYRIRDVRFNDKQIKAINSIDTHSKIMDRINAIKKLGGELEFSKVDHTVFKDNLVIIDSCMPGIIGEALKIFFTTKNTTVKDVVDVLETEDPLNYKATSGHKFYEYKFKRLLTDAALGMTPAKVWNGHYDANGGYLVVKDNGEVLCYHIYNKNEFENYLFCNTHFETPSSTRYGFGRIEKDGDDFIFKLNLQIRFTK